MGRCNRMKSFIKTITYNDEEYVVVNYHRPDDETTYILEIYKTGINGKNYVKVWTIVGSEKIAMFANNPNNFVDIHEEDYYINLIKYVFKDYIKYVIKENIEERRLEELDNWDGIIE